jgi:hypothetical protein
MGATDNFQPPFQGGAVNKDSEVGMAVLSLLGSLCLEHTAQTNA